jgi:hypothetical protein
MSYASESRLIPPPAPRVLATAQPGYANDGGPARRLPLH